MSIKVYGRSMCGDTVAVREALEGGGHSYEWIDLEAAPERWAEALAANGDDKRVPTVLLGDGTVLVEPSADVLLARLTVSGE